MRKDGERGEDEGECECMVAEYEHDDMVLCMVVTVWLG